MFLIVWLSLQSWTGAATLAFLVFIIAALSDWLDGAIARRRGITSNFGKFMDALTDKILVIGLMVSFIGIFDIPLFYVLITICREFLVSGMRMVVAAKGIVVPADGGGKVKTIVQMVSIGLLLFSSVLRQDLACFSIKNIYLAVLWVYIGGMTGFIIGTFLTIWSGFRYFRSNWAVFIR